ncbi:exosortase system-associated protein, TIGR04073 family [Geomonas sp. RF6]|uniref:exosortase system-associated protein, TIGR04073 family n=1 Tax=Geomonas sp. RF6 TaxID=2897342 RepID=UPI001E4056C2|nr:exosortase system-associated protein, TIGR04073 family [Geomonas sp. RF6]UFS72038.1 exosortase system-associated protein, TIGR04073 family [Geomonas sp. RF6]
MQIKWSLRIVLVAVLLAAGLTARQAQADPLKSIEDSAPQEVVDGMANKAARGVANVATGWVEVPKQIAMTMKEDGVAMGLTVGPLKGVGMALVRTGAGVAEALTFFIAWPEFYEPYIEPAYVWQKE